MANTNLLTSPNVDKDMEQWESPHVVGVYKHFENSLSLSYKARYTPNLWTNTTFRNYPREMKTYVYTKTWTAMFIACVLCPEYVGE